MAELTSVQRFVLLPPRGMRATGIQGSPVLTTFLTSLSQLHGTESARASVGTGPGLRMKVLDSIHEDGAKLVEMSPETALALRAAQPSLLMVPEVFYKPAVVRYEVRERFKTAAGALTTRIKLKIASKADGKPVAGALVVAFIDFANRIGAQGTTNNSGEISLNLGAAKKKLQRLYVYPAKNHWGALKKNLTVTTGTVVGLEGIDLGFTDCLRHFYGGPADDAGAGVRVGIVDSGVDLAHPDLSVAGGENTVTGENAANFGDNGREGHGTHVAGIVGARGTPPTGMRGVAPAASIFSFRVFGQGQDRASNFAIAKAIDRAVALGCDLVNMSLGGGPADALTRLAIDDARNAGVAVIVAAGNDDRSPVSFPAAEPLAIAISAMGRKGTFPVGSTTAGDVAAPFGKDKKNFVASFSNIGTEIDLTGPGVGVVSTVPGGHAPMSGTSMACPAVTGFAARLLSGQPAIMNMSRDQARSDAILQMLTEAAKKLGFGPPFEGQGLPR